VPGPRFSPLRPLPRSRHLAPPPTPRSHPRDHTHLHLCDADHGAVRVSAPGQIGAGAAHRRVRNATAPPASPWGASDQIIVSGWFEGLVCVHNMRASPAPMLTFADPWSLEPIYTVAATYIDHHTFEIAF
jgi:hypothetical protein